VINSGEGGWRKPTKRETELLPYTAVGFAKTGTSYGVGLPRRVTDNIMGEGRKPLPLPEPQVVPRKNREEEGKKKISV